MLTASSGSLMEDFASSKRAWKPKVKTVSTDCNNGAAAASIEALPSLFAASMMRKSSSSNMPPKKSQSSPYRANQKSNYVERSAINAVAVQKEDDKDVQTTVVLPVPINSPRLGTSSHHRSPIVKPKLLPSSATTSNESNCAAAAGVPSLFKSAVTKSPIIRSPVRSPKKISAVAAPLKAAVPPAAVVVDESKASRMIPHAPLTEVTTPVTPVQKKKAAVATSATTAATKKTAARAAAAAASSSKKKSASMPVAKSSAPAYVPRSPKAAPIRYVGSPTPKSPNKSAKVVSVFHKKKTPLSNSQDDAFASPEPSTVRSTTTPPLTPLSPEEQQTLINSLTNLVWNVPPTPKIDIDQTESVLDKLRQAECDCESVSSEAEKLDRDNTEQQQRRDIQDKLKEFFSEDEMNLDDTTGDDDDLSIGSDSSSGSTESGLFRY